MNIEMGRSVIIFLLMGILLTIPCQTQVVEILKDSNRQMLPKPVPFKYRYHVDNFDEMDGSALQQAKEESSDGKNIRGRYSVRMPDGRLQVVTYSTGPDGYVANVHYENDFIRSGPSFLSDRDDNKKVAPQFTASTPETFVEDGFDPDSTPITKEPVVTDRTTRRKKHRRKQKNIEEVEATTTFAQLSDRPATRRSEKVLEEPTFTSEPPPVTDRFTRRRNWQRKVKDAQSQGVFEDESLLEDPSMTSEVPVTSVRPSRRRNNRRKQKKTGPEMIQLADTGKSKQTLEHDELLGEPNATSETPVTAIRSGRRRNNQRRPKKIEHFEVNTEAVQMTVNRKPQRTLEDEDSGEEFSFPLEEPITTVRSSKRLNNRRRQKKFEDAELTTESALLRKPQRTFVDEDFLERADFMTDELAAAVRPTKPQNSQRRQKKVDDFEATTRSAQLTGNRKSKKIFKDEELDEDLGSAEEVSAATRATNRQQNGRKQWLMEEVATAAQFIESTEKPITRSSRKKPPKWTNKRLRNDPNFSRIFTKLSDKSSFQGALLILDKKRKSRTEPPLQKSPQDQIHVSDKVNIREEEEDSQDEKPISSRKHKNHEATKSTSKLDEDHQPKDWIAPSFSDNQTNKPKIYRFETSNKALAGIVSKILEDSVDDSAVDSL